MRPGGSIFHFLSLGSDSSVSWPLFLEIYVTEQKHDSLADLISVNSPENGEYWGVRKCLDTNQIECLTDLFPIYVTNIYVTRKVKVPYGF